MTKPNSRYSPSILWLAVPILAAALWVGFNAGRKQDAELRAKLTLQALNIAATISPDAVRQLSFTSADAESIDYKILCEQMQVYAKEAGLQSLYTMALRDGRLIFGPESLLPGDPFASPPGTVYEKPDDKSFEIFKTARSITYGPVSDEYGTFVSVLAPVIDPQTHQVVLVAGIDIEATQWLRQILEAQISSALFALLPLAALLAGYVILRRRKEMPEPRKRAFRHTETATCAVTMLLLTLVIARLFYREENSARKAEFRAQAQLEMEIFRDTFDRLARDIDMLAIFFESSDYVTASEFSTFADRLIAMSPIKACAWLPEVPANGLRAFEERIRAEYRPGFTVYSLSGSVSPEQPVFYPVLYVAAADSHEILFGYDSFSDPIRREAIEAARKTGQTFASDPLHLVTEPDAPAGFHLFQEVQNDRQPGVVGMAIRPAHLFAGMVRSAPTEQDLSISFIWLPRHDEAAVPLACTENKYGIDSEEHHLSGVKEVCPLFAFGQAYALRIHPTSEWYAAHPLSSWPIILTSGLMLTSLLTLVVGALVRRPEKLEKLVRQKTAELAESNLRFEQLAKQGRTVIWEVNASGRYTYVNHVARDVYGYTPEKLIGRKYFYDLHPEEGREEFKAAAFSVFDAQRSFNDFENRIQTKSGTIIWVATIGTPLLSPDGLLIGYRGSDVDITDRKLAELAAKEHTAELAQFNDAAVGRELRMIELKQEVNELCRKLGRPEPYPPETEES